MSEKEIIFLPCAGLANRLRAIASAMTYAEEHGYQLRILWDHQTNIFMAPFQKCFQVGQLPKWVCVEDHKFTMNTAWNQAVLLKADTDVAAVLQKTNVVKSYYAFYKEGSPEWLTHLRRFLPHNDIQMQIQHTFQDIRPPIVGVHIRRTDHVKSIQNSPTKKFIEAMRLCSPDTLFYIASDSVEERELISREFPGRVFLGPMELYGRNDYFGSLDAVLDLYCLSRCQKIIGSFGSSFSEIAGQIGGIPLKVMYTVGNL